MRFRRGLWLVGIGVGGLVVVMATRRRSEPAPTGGSPAVTLQPEAGGVSSKLGLKYPTGELPKLSCAGTKAIVRQARELVVREPSARDIDRFAVRTLDWTDPHGFWTASKRSPPGDELRARAPALLRELESSGTECPVASEIGEAIRVWVNSLRTSYREGLAVSVPMDEALSAGAFDDHVLELDPRTMVHGLGSRVGSLGRAFGREIEASVELVDQRLFPEFAGEAWAEVVLAAALRAYVTVIDPHGGWAPVDEESSIYDVALTARPPVPLWANSSRTTLGLRVEEGAVAPLVDGDMLLSIGPTVLAGLSLEQVEQLATAIVDAEDVTEAALIRGGKLVHVLLGSAEGPGTTSERSRFIRTTLVPYADREAAIVRIPDVRDDLGRELAEVLAELNSKGTAGLVLDLRGNGGGSSDGAFDALGTLLPGAPLFPMLHRDGSVEVDRASESEQRWAGPVAVLVDGDTASAAEMIAGAISAYHRGPVVGLPTFGKGCAQEYFDDVTTVGVLRLTTLIFALPDGSPLQRVGIRPTIRFPFSPSTPVLEDVEHERTLPNAPPEWRGPDVRDRELLTRIERNPDMVWPAHRGRVGPCEQEEVCRSLLALSRSTPVASTFRGKRK